MPARQADARIPVISDGLDDGQSWAKSAAAAGLAYGEALKRLEEPVYYGHWDRGP